MSWAYLYVNNFFPASLAWELRSLHRRDRRARRERRKWGNGETAQPSTQRARRGIGEPSIVPAGVSGFVPMNRDYAVTGCRGKRSEVPGNGNAGGLRCRHVREPAGLARKEARFFSKHYRSNGKRGSRATRRMTVPPDLLPRDGKGSKQWNQIPVVSSTSRATQHTTSCGIGHPLGLTVCGMLAKVVGDDLVSLALKIEDALGGPPRGVPETSPLQFLEGTRTAAAVGRSLRSQPSERSRQTHGGSGAEGPFDSLRSLRAESGTEGRGVQTRNPASSRSIPARRDYAVTRCRGRPGQTARAIRAMPSDHNLSPTL
jgi:hypothetical protein